MDVQAIVEKIQSTLPGGAEVYLRDLTGGGDHFDAFVVSQAFEGKSRIERHRLVMDALKDLLSGPLHAISIKTFTPQDWETAQKG